MLSKLPDFAAPYYRDVVAFQEKYGLTVEGMLSIEQYLLRHQLMVEEYAEMVLAFRSDDLPEFADALGDLRYVLCGTAALLGIVIPDNDVVQSFGNKPPTMPKQEHFLYYQGRLLHAISDVATRFAWMVQTGPNKATGASLIHADELVSTIARMGYIPMGAVHRAIHAANMQKLRAPSKDNKRKSQFDVIKPEGWTPPDIRGVLVDHGWPGERGVAE